MALALDMIVHEALQGRGEGDGLGSIDDRKKKRGREEGRGEERGGERCCLLEAAELPISPYLASHTSVIPVPGSQRQIRALEARLHRTHVVVARPISIYVHENTYIFFNPLLHPSRCSYPPYICPYPIYLPVASHCPAIDASKSRQCIPPVVVDMRYQLLSYLSLSIYAYLSLP